MFSIRFQNNELSPDRLAPFATETANNYDKIGSLLLHLQTPKNIEIMKVETDM
jgi:hypothetical protein